MVASLERNGNLPFSDAPPNVPKRLSTSTTQTSAGESGSKEGDSPPWSFLSRTAALPFVTVVYAGAYLAAWVIIAISVYKPITERSYSYHKDRYSLLQYPYTYGKSEQWLRAARVLGSVVSVLTIPITLGVCSQTAVVILQGRLGRGMTLRQTMALADKGWADTGLLSRMVLGRRWRYHASPFFYVALALTLLGASITPVQELFVSYKTIKVPSYPDGYSSGVINSLCQLGTLPIENSWTPVQTLRSRLTTTYPSDPQPRLWYDDVDSSCQNDTYIGDDICQNAMNNNTLGQLPEAGDHYWSELPRKFQTGLITQYAPRVNHSVLFQTITHDAWPEDCVSGTNQSLFLEHFATTQFRTINTTVCMPRSLQHTELRQSNLRQDFSEVMFLQVAFSDLIPNASIYGGIYTFVTPGTYAIEVNVNTTVGYFELPNYANNQVAGEILKDDPITLCDANEGCNLQVFNLYMEAHQNNVDPLLRITASLFGNGSTVVRPPDPDDRQICPLQAPLLQFSINKDELDDEQYCGEFALENYLWSILGLKSDQKTMENAFEAAAFIAADVTLGGSIAASGDVTQSLGDDFLVPVSSTAGIALVSALLGTFLISLLSLSAYNARVERWTTRLDSFAMMRIGAAIYKDLPMDYVSEVDKVKVLDETPGWIGDESGVSKDRAKIHQLGLGAPTPLNRKYRYQSHPGSAWVAPTPQEWGRQLPLGNDGIRGYQRVGFNMM